jgi:hypothetical protein
LALDFGLGEERCLRTLIAHRVEFLVVGGYAVRYHGVLRPAKDVDVLAGNDSANADRLCDALSELIGVRHPNLTPDQISGRKRQINFAEWGYKFEVLTAGGGIDFPSAYSNGITVQLGTIDVPVIAKADLLAMKRHAARPQDQSDVDALEAV